MIAKLQRWLFPRQVEIPPDYLDHPLLFFGAEPLRLRDCLEGILITGSSGSGKTSGSGAAVAKAFLTHGFGGIVLCTKPNEPDLWRRYARETRRDGDLIFFGPRHSHRFNYLNFAAGLSPRDLRPTENITHLLGTVIDVANRGQSTNSQDPYWSRAAQQLLRNAVDLVLLARGAPNLTLHEIYQAIISAPIDSEQLNSKQWQGSSRCMQLLDEAHRNPQDPIATHDLTITANYWLKEYPNLSPRTRGCVVSMVTTGIDPLLRGTVHELTNTTTTVTPNQTHRGKILILDLPAKRYHAAGILIQLIWKQLWQQATEARIVDTNTRPTFLFCDEAQTFVTKNDSTFLMTARSSRASVVYLTQNIPNFRSALGKAETDALISNLVTRVHHQNMCPDTNMWATESISKCWRLRASSGTSRSDDSAGTERISRTANLSDSHEFEVPPEEFLRLRRGGPTNHGKVDAIISRPWPHDRNFLRVTFTQS
jgi:type IV secretory pathway TraG/TraD family ATPase VirD4